MHTYKQIYIAPKSWKRIRGTDSMDQYKNATTIILLSSATSISITDT